MPVTLTTSLLSRWSIGAALLIGLLFAGNATAGGHSGGAAVTLETFRGVMRCELTEDGGDCGTSEWVMTIQSDGSRSIRVINKRDPGGAQNNIFLRVDEAFRPIEGFASLYNGGEFLGAGLFLVGPDTLTATYSSADGVAEQSLSIPSRFTLLLHPPPADGWQFGHHYDREKGGVQTGAVCGLGGVRGTPMCRVSEQRMEFLGQPELEVGAGQFKTDHYRFGENTEVWTTGPHRIVVQHIYKTFGTRYTLEQLTRE